MNSHKTNRDSNSNNILDFLLQENKSKEKKSNLVSLIEKLGKNFIELVKTYKGSRFFQEMIPKEKISKKDSNYITKIIGVDFNEIICDYYGNYFLQKLFPILSKEDRIKIYN